MNKKFHGIIPPLVTPLLEDGSFDRESFKRLIDRLIDAGCHGLFVLGSSGEVVFSTDARRREIIAAAVEFNAGRVPVLVGCIDTETNRVIEHAKVAQELGADAIVATAPFYALQGLEEIERHFRLIHEACELPLFAYDIPVCVHTKLPHTLLVRLGQEGVLAGVKDSSGDDVSFRFLVQDNERAGHPLTILTGHEVVVDGAYLSGADGAVPGLGNVDPAAYVRQWNAYQNGDWETVRAEQDRLADLMRIVFVPQDLHGYGAGVGSFKSSLMLQGVFTSNTMPAPVRTQSAEVVQGIGELLKAHGVL
ncbi:dihydrodipicolinate synthase family protein [Corynebacterium sp. ES2794-CONJ1]|uniref:dihydrodipicolinate synthase family protein n=1 Tax=unclassified Corynebacterium TaxID=2624378 RepID=UPI0021683A48|nr:MULTISPECIES: dihydrodipicolinate synthase family protein [unclassified Corynebacterium]MCS4489993.1 dihydrodipicolinate synthase family protein [Corynebacterium sp. ES2775-CONJ]MCS4491644.1 dihydrodipicolinate synthase family protein [Corynebacterium sp. ES2715-CONJ3]MCS4531749.1 dihydrodipicolinate synthase family protein [Corynebacterium sp. ES2730-CONJ]MCU9519145.1 dihydrodipicolinate synthase family protein [Corynebacterium sp. ES2794-CONJ1]